MNNEWISFLISFQRRRRRRPRRPQRPRMKARSIRLSTSGTVSAINLEGTDHSCPLHLRQNDQPCPNSTTVLFQFRGFPFFGRQEEGPRSVGQEPAETEGGLQRAAGERRGESGQEEQERGDNGTCACMCNSREFRRKICNWVVFCM